MYRSDNNFVPAIIESIGMIHRNYPACLRMFSHSTTFIIAELEVRRKNCRPRNMIHATYIKLFPFYHFHCFSSFLLASFFLFSFDATNNPCTKQLRYEVYCVEAECRLKRNWRRHQAALEIELVLSAASRVQWTTSFSPCHWRCATLGWSMNKQFSAIHR